MPGILYPGSRTLWRSDHGRLMKFELDIYQLFEVFCKEIRSILEMAVPVWHSGLTSQQSSDIESIQKLAMKIIIQDKYVTYQLACITFSAKTLFERRLQLSSKFETKNIKTGKKHERNQM